MWEQLERITTEFGTIVLFGAQPFTSALGASNLKLLKYSLMWHKNRPTGHAHAKNRFMRKFEDILVFSKGVINHANLSNKRMTFNPQGLKPLEKTRVHYKKRKNSETTFTKSPSNKDTTQTVEGYPNDILEFPMHRKNRLHPTQKPVELLEYLIKTYSNENENVLDFTMGSGSTGVACVNTNRNFTGIELDDKYFEIAKNRIEDSQTTIF